MLVWRRRLLLAASIITARAQELPAYMAPLAGKTTATPSEIATKDVLALNTVCPTSMASAANIFQRNILSKHPVILGLFSGSGGRLILYRPGQALPIDAPQVPMVYQLLKSVGHSTMALAQVVGPYLDNKADTSWRGAMLGPTAAACNPRSTGSTRPQCRSNGATTIARS